MFTSSFSRLSALCSALTFTAVVFASPLPHAPRAPAPIPSGPKFVVYTDKSTGNPEVLPPLDQIQGFNVVNLAFLLSDGPHDQVLNWASLDATTRQGIKQKYNAAGVSVVVSAFGQTELPTTNGLDPTALANQMSQFVLNTDLDGIDVDWEEIALVTQSPGVGEQWLATFTQTLRSQLPQGQFILTHAPVGPWFQPQASFCPGGCYLTVDKTVGSLIDWYNIQFYNQSPSPGYDDCNTLLNSAGGSAVFEIQKSGVDINKLVIGKPGGVDDVSEKQRPTGGLIDPTTLGTCIQQAVSQGWKAGVMSFQFPNSNTAWISTVKGNSFA
ncbi:glycoside hydrolase [Lentinus tigrinus ALCF2SS1-7]|uniref:Glycoside hydrolase n=1 Tax=Lentinus tigrinus ALCF2SS1-6 TaxID=1328759 RepID=A0A5C2SHT8_9APHY|nr:glycoside hydrolase [Lentinus tigrinus ALCF2SS1-6]RPD77200.1 glycoside hydrolase [Lentinus tigrinus ALCF2SS1-7]